jgi:hypothetical protein
MDSQNISFSTSWTNVPISMNVLVRLTRVYGIAHTEDLVWGSERGTSAKSTASWNKVSSVHTELQRKTTNLHGE